MEIESDDIVKKAMTPDEVVQYYHIFRPDSDVSVIEYKDVIAADSIDSLFTLNPTCCIIFYPFMKSGRYTQGHYVALCRDEERKAFWYYDSLAYKPDQYKDKVPNRYALYNENENTLIRHLLEMKLEGYTIDYNDKQVQSRLPQIATCGRFTALRCACSNLSNSEFNTLLDRLAVRFLEKKERFRDNLFKYI